jgi:hypothetical protein
VPASSFAEQPARQCVRSRCRSIEDCAQTAPSRAGIRPPILKTGAWQRKSNIPPAERKRYWDQAVSQTYFPLELGFRGTSSFAGDLEVWSLGNLSISRNVSDGFVYRRHQRHVLHDREDSYLITVPELSAISFTQDGTEVRCRPGAFLTERSHLPYEFSYAEPNALWVRKVPSVLRARIGRIERVAPLSLDATRASPLLQTCLIES